MTPRVWATWLPSAMFLLQATGSLSLSGPHTVRGTVGESLSVQCRYEEKFRGNKKYWCENPCTPVLKNKIVETSESEREVSNGRVSIRDHPANLTFTVTFERLTKHDAGKYWCGIAVSLNQRIVDPNFEVEVIVSPAPLPTWKIFNSTLGPPSSSLPETTLLNTTRPETPDPHQHPTRPETPDPHQHPTRPETPDPHQHPGALLSSVRFLLLVFLKLPLLLSMLGAVLWVNRPQGCSGRGGPPHSENQ